MENKKQTRRGGFYWKDGKSYISVTNCLKILDKPQIRFWFGKQIYWAVVANPTISEAEALAAPYETSGKAATRGTTVHDLIELYKHTGEEKKPPSPFNKFIEAFYKWVKDNDIEILEQEKTVFSEKHNFAGTLDLLVKNKQSGKTFVVDIKTSKEGRIYPETALQVSAYFEALKEQGKQVDSIGAIGLSQKGNYTFQELEPCFEIFLNCKSIWEWQNKDIIEALKKGGKNGSISKMG